MALLKTITKKSALKAIIVICVLYGVLNLIMVQAFTKARTVPQVRNFLQYVAVHIDLKGAPPTLDYLKKVLKEIKHLGANSLLIEYEDIFPYTGTIANISSPHHYKRDELRKFLKTAANLGLEIIPLIQIFGHMEFALKLPQYEGLRENRTSFRDICPSRNESLKLIEEMLTQVLSFHSEIAPLRHFHIGCDEVDQLNQCNVCQRRKIERVPLFMHHVQSVRNIINSLSPSTTVLIWDDMLRNKKPEVWRNINDTKNIELVYWQYHDLLQLSHTDLRFYHHHFQNIWIASAFKGADGPTSIAPNFKKRLANHYEWMKLTENYKFGGEKEIFRFKGIALTGWSRYHHFAPLCDLLPLSLPSLYADLLVIKTFKHRFGIKSHNFTSFFNEYVKDRLEHLLACKYIDANGNGISTCNHILINPFYKHVEEYLKLIKSKTKSRDYMRQRKLLKSIRKNMAMYPEDVRREYIGNHLAVLNSTQLTSIL